ncbi:hypothetical protein LK994_11205 [Ferruginibacter lapsinanis]|uniref:hypothetical protein n=1 Tax=Ferruginibacter lapsinanis TaxID=563172 RepID=UPI001E5BC1EE|nr:hypothetical protein [Ferruginibacter lapsinanis]UEG49198.1 hypothetical protein LK994_11205 [Ferruginibacter lapsinanis]
MNQTIQILFEGIGQCSPEEKANRLAAIGRYMRSGADNTHNEEIAQTVQELVNLLPLEDNLIIRKLLFRNISAAYTQTSGLADIQLTPILEMLNESGPVFICNTLHLLSLTYNIKYSPVISRYLYYADDKVREVAINALTFMQHKPSQKRSWDYSFN